MICANCTIVFKGYKNQKYCSVKCRDHAKWLRIKDNSSYKIKQKIRNRKYEITHKEQRKKDRNKRQKTKPYRDRQNKWRKNRKYWLYQYAANPEANRLKSRKFRQTDKGKINDIKSNEHRRKKFPKNKQSFNKKDLMVIKKRDSICVYCKHDFIINHPLYRPTIDHFDSNKSLSLTNAVCACQSCNSSKRNIPLSALLGWIKRKKFKPKKIVYKLFNIHKIKTKRFIY